jgi:glutamyl-Q tRNA(Asp) synthetase
MTLYTGRFAPSPTGPLHFGSLVAAVASYCDAKSQQGHWLLRIEDLDKPREIQGASKQIIETLLRFGFEWDGDIVYQSDRTALYQQAFNQLKAMDWLYPCTCSRKEIADSSQLIGIEGVIYPKTCLHQAIKPNTPKAWRIKTENITLKFEDNIQGLINYRLSQEIGDFVVLRTDQIFTYQLAVVVDDAAQGVTHIVRGADLLHSTPRQLYCQQLLNLPCPRYAHIPIARNAQGEKLSKQTRATKIEQQDASRLLFEALTFLHQEPPASLMHASIASIWEWAIAHWDIHRISIPHHFTHHK